EKVNGENKGIRHTFRVTEDQFAQGDRTLVNHKKYYYLAISYATNNYKTYNPNDPDALDGQKLIYLASRKAGQGPVKTIEVIPHNPTPELGGTAQRIGYGSSPRITRIDGYGNGFRSLELTAESAAEILTTGFMKTPEYDYGQGPVAIKVVDPLNLVGGYFECKFRNYSTTPSNGADTASWVIYRYDQKGGNALDSVSSEKTISVNNEQIIPQWGVSVQITQEKYILDAISPSDIEKSKTTMIEDPSITFKDSSKVWLAGVQDNDAFFPTNWIRSGTYASATTDCLPTGPAYLNPCNYNDEVGQDDNKLFAKLLGGTIAPHRLVGYQGDFMPIAYY
ncbi:MAG: T9SS C-terminal target domain-containing protein, partial [bacterium]